MVICVTGFAVEGGANAIVRCSAEIKFNLLFFGNGLFIAKVFLFFADIAKMVARFVIAMVNSMIEGALITDGVTPGFGQHPVSHQILIEADNEKVLLFVPANNQGVRP